MKNSDFWNDCLTKSREELSSALKLLTAARRVEDIASCRRRLQALRERVAYQEKLRLLITLEREKDYYWRLLNH